MKKHILSLHWKLFFPLIGTLWLIIGITICYFVSHEKQRQKENLENRLLNVNATVIDAYEQGGNLQETVDFIRLFADNTTLAPLRITVYDHNGVMVADNPAETIHLSDSTGNPIPELMSLIHSAGRPVVDDIEYDNVKSMVSAMSSPDGTILTLAALPYRGEVRDFLSTDPMIWAVVVLLGIISSALAYLGVRAISRNVYALRDFAGDIANDRLPDNIDNRNFSNDELGDVSRNLLTLYREKIHAEQEKMQHERQISQNISHELNTPIGIIKGYIDTVLADSRMPEKTRHEFLMRAKQNTDRLASLVSDLNALMRLQGDRDVLQFTNIDFTHLVSRLSEDVVQGHIADDMIFEYSIPAGCRVVGHDHLLTNALLNLIFNAARHSGGTKMSLIWLRSENGMHIFRFADNGSGVDEEHLKRLFDLFYRVDYGRTRKSGGAGLGLPLVMRIITSMGGNIWVENAPSGGLEFTFSLKTAP